MHRFAPARLVLPDWFALGDLSDGSPGSLFGADPPRSGGDRATTLCDEIVASERVLVRKLAELPSIKDESAAEFVCGEEDS